MFFSNVSKENCIGSCLLYWCLASGIVFLSNRLSFSCNVNIKEHKWLMFIGVTTVTILLTQCLALLGLQLEIRNEKTLPSLILFYCDRLFDKKLMRSLICISFF